MIAFIDGPLNIAEVLIGHSKNNANPMDRQRKSGAASWISVCMLQPMIFSIGAVLASSYGKEIKASVSGTKGFSGMGCSV